MTEKADIGLIGLAVMGQNLVLNMNDHGFKVAVYNRTVSMVDEFLDGNAARAPRSSAPTRSRSWSSALEKPRRVMLLVKAGQPVDDFIDRLIPLLDQGDIIIDGGNSNYNDTIRRTEDGRVEGAALHRHRRVGRRGGRAPRAVDHARRLAGGLAARQADLPGDRRPRWRTASPCCDWVGENGAGHFVKMVHNGIEYGDMQLICEAYHLMKEGLGLGHDRMHRDLRRVERGRARLLPDRDHPRHPRLPRRKRRAGGREDPRHRRPEGHRQVDGDLGARHGHPADPDRRGGAGPLSVGAQGGAGGGLARCSAGPETSFDGDADGIHRRPPTGALRLEDRLLRPGLHADARRGGGVRLEPQLRRHRPHVARRLHHPLGLPRQDQGGLRPRPRS